MLLKLGCKNFTEDNITVRIIPETETGEDYSEGQDEWMGRRNLEK